MNEAETQMVDRICELTARAGPNEFQHYPEELAHVVLYMANIRNCDSYLEIGAGRGHVARVLHTLIGLSIVRLIDDGCYFGGRLTQVPHAKEWIGDSTSQSAIKAVDDWGMRFDLIMIDANHSYNSVKADTKLAMRVAASVCYLCFHDTERPDVTRWIGEWESTYGAILVSKIVHVPGTRGTALFRYTSEYRQEVDDERSTERITSEIPVADRTASVSRRDRWLVRRSEQNRDASGGEEVKGHR